MRSIVCATGHVKPFVTGSLVDALDYYIECNRLGLNVPLIVDSKPQAVKTIEGRYSVERSLFDNIRELKRKEQRLSKALMFASSPLHTETTGISATEAKAVLSRTSSTQTDAFPAWIEPIAFGKYIKKMQTRMLEVPEKQDRCSYVNVTSITSLTKDEARVMMSKVPSGLVPMIYARIPSQLDIISKIIEIRPDSKVVTGEQEKLFEKFCHVLYVNDDSDYSPRMIVECAVLGIPVTYHNAHGGECDSLRKQLLEAHGPEHFDIQNGDSLIGWLGE